jgi:hypothetical protein
MLSQLMGSAFSCNGNCWNVTGMLSALESNTLICQRNIEEQKSQDSVFGNSLIHPFWCFLVLGMMTMTTMMTMTPTTMTVDCGGILKCVDTFANSLHVIFIIHVFG